MNAATAPSSATSKGTSERRVARLFGLSGDAWMRHANPWSVWTRFAAVPVLAAAVWSRVWLGWWSLLPIALVLVFIAVNPLLFAQPSSTRNWASRAVFGERVWAEREDVDLPHQFRHSLVPNMTTAFQVAGLALLVYGLVVLDPLGAVTGLVIMQLAKGWYLDRMVLLYQDVQTRRPEYAAWDIG
jgi:hypothetical protein